MKIKINSQEIEISEEQAREIAEKYGKKQRRFVPEDGYDYWCVDGSGQASCFNWGGYGSDIFRLKTGNLFRTEEEAQAHADKLHAIAKVTEYIYENKMNVSEEEVNDKDVQKCYFYYDLECNRLRFSYVHSCKKYSPIPYINSEENAEKLLKKFPEELNKIYM